ncbi:MAG TPA: phosphotransferase, partial [Steroidobacteraceae bacterium]|nr:phosphotransferase [Steroidobacteraceae bacterium]
MDLNISTDVRKAALETWLAGLLAGAPARIAPASADASFRRYFRVWQDGRTYIAMDAPPGREDLGPFIQIAEILAAAGVNVPQVLERDADRGFLLLTDLGSRLYLDALREGDDPDRLYGDAI